MNHHLEQKYGFLWVWALLETYGIMQVHNSPKYITKFLDISIWKLYFSKRCISGGIVCDCYQRLLLNAHIHLTTCIDKAMLRYFWNLLVVSISYLSRQFLSFQKPKFLNSWLKVCPKFYTVQGPKFTDWKMANLVKSVLIGKCWR